MPSTTFLFWKLQKKPLLDRVARLAMHQRAAIVVVAECVSDPERMVAELRSATEQPFQWVEGSGDRLHVYTCLPLSGWRRLIADPLEGWLGFRIRLPKCPAWNLFVAHLPSKLWAGAMDQVLNAAELAKDITSVEKRERHERTLLVGDLNANPFETATAWAGSLHGVMTADIARRETRGIRGRDYPMFYNPMWGVLGDRTPGPPGTYYRTSSETVNYFWNAYDQVLLRPALMDWLSDLQIMTTDGVNSLVTSSGLPDAATGSDHLPLIFRLTW